MAVSKAVELICRMFLNISKKTFSLSLDASFFILFPFISPLYFLPFSITSMRRDFDALSYSIPDNKNPKFKGLGIGSNFLFLFNLPSILEFLI